MSALAPSRRASRIGESATLAIAARALALRAAGVDVVSLAAGEPDFDTPEPIRAAGIDAIRTGNTRYTATSGTPELRAAAREWFRASYGLDFAADQLIVTAGAKPALHMALTTLVEPGDRVLLCAPYWVSYPDMVRIAGGEPVDIPAAPERGFVVDPDEITAAAAACRAKGIIVNYPNNPSGAVPAPEQMEAIVEAALRANLWIISDEIYGKLLYGDASFHSAASFACGRDRILIVNGGTKSHSLTGWRIGFLAGPAPIITAAGRIQSQVLGNPCTISQAAALVFCRGADDEEQSRRLAAFDERRQFVVRTFRSLPGISLREPKGAFYALLDTRALCARLRVDDLELARRILEEAHVALVPGSAFAIPGFLRLSYAASLADLRRGAGRIAEFLTS